MATTKKTTETKTTETEAKAKAPKVIDDGMEDILIPLDRSSEEPYVYCAVNGEAMLIPRGETVRIPHKYAAAVKLHLASQRDHELMKKREREKDLARTQAYVNATM